MSAVLGDIVLGDWILADEDVGGSPLTANVGSADATSTAEPITAGLTLSASVGSADATSTAEPITAGFDQTASLGSADGGWAAPAITVALVGECWEGVTRRLLGYLAPPFTTNVFSRLGRTMATVARELSNCTEDVTLTDSTDPRGDGSYTITTRFEPITAVGSVRRIDPDTGSVLQTYDVDSFDGRKITLRQGVKYGDVKYGQCAYAGSPPGQGDTLQVTYTYLHKGLEFRIREAMRELNILTSTGEFLDNWGRIFGVPRITTGKYGSVKYGGMKYGGSGREADTPYARRIIDSIIQIRNTKPAILAAVKRLMGVSPQTTAVYGGAKYGSGKKYGSTSGQPYMVEWFEPGVDRGWVFKPAGLPEWRGANNETATKYHLIWGQTARFLNSLVDTGGGCVLEVWVPPPSAGASYSLGQVLQVANAKKAAGIRIYIRQFIPKRQVAAVDSGSGVETFTLVATTPPTGPTTALSLYRFDPGAGLLADEGTKLSDLTRSDICEA